MSTAKKLAAMVKTGFRTISPTCRDVARLQSDALDQDLGIPKRLGMRIHLLMCRWCRRYGKQIRFLRLAARDHGDDLCQASPQSLSPGARERLKRALRDDLL
jgi:hypothetical protein